jgi:TLC domain
MLISLVAIISAIRISLVGVKVLFPSLISPLTLKLKLTDRGKLHECLWYAMYHTYSFLSNFFLLRNAPWTNQLTEITDSPLCVTDPSLNSSDSVVQFYNQALAFWITCLLFISVETKRQDHKQLIMHHLITILLISLSLSHGYTRFGLIVLAIHDIGDIFLWVRLI